MAKINRENRKNRDDVNIEKMDDSTSKLYIATSQVNAVTDKGNVQSYENYLNDKYLTGAIVRKPDWKKYKSKGNLNINN